MHPYIRDPLTEAPLWLIAIVLFGAMIAAAFGGQRLRARYEQRRLTAAVVEDTTSQEGYIVAAVTGLLSLLLGFTFALAVDRYETRRTLVLDEANAIGTTYLRSQLLDEPHRARLSALLSAYVDNRLALGLARRVDAAAPMIVENERLLTELWAATVAAFPTMKDYDFSSSYLETMNQIIDLDAARKTARFVRVPTTVLAVLFAYQVITAGVLGFVLHAPRGQAAGRFLVLLFGLSLLLIVDIDRPVLGLINESQAPMQRLQDFLAARPPEIFDRLDGRDGP